jgi:hypothetical protein
MVIRAIDKELAPISATDAIGGLMHFASMRLQHWQAFLFLLIMTPWISCAYADEWVSRGHGSCFDWRGRWMVDRDQSGVWAGNIDFVHIGGTCTPGTHSLQTDEVRAVIVGGDFFARRNAGTLLCVLHGSVRGEEIRGYEICDNGANVQEFALQLTSREPEWRDGERGERERLEPEPPQR